MTRLAARVALAVDDRRAGPGEAFRLLLPGVRYDFHDVAEVDGRMDRYGGIDKPVLLMSGTRSPAFLQNAVGRLAGVIPGSRSVELPGLGHDGPWNTGRPTAVAEAIRTFLGET